MSHVRTTITRLLWKLRGTSEVSTIAKGSKISLPLDLTDKAVHDEYVSYSSRLRLGKIMEDLDAVAGTVAHQHCGKGPRIVTAACDRVDILGSLGANKFSVDGRVTHVGRTSMEVTVTLNEQRTTCQENSNESVGLAAGSSVQSGSPSIRAVFLMAARDPTTGKGYSVPPLDIPEDDIEAKRLWDLGETHRAQRTLEKSRDPIVLHNIRQPYIQSVFLAQPQHRNLAGHIFGGWLIRRAVETSMAAAHIVAGEHGDPFVLSIDEISFERPVFVGDISRLDAHVLFVSTSSAVIAVETWVIDVSRRKGCGERALTFMFTIALGRHADPRSVEGLVDVGGAVWEEGARIWGKAREHAEREGSELIKEFGERPVVTL